MAAMRKIPYDKKRCARSAAIFKTLSHPQRLQLFCCLCEKDTDGQRPAKQNAPSPRP